uniref:Uncharacterized protein n=1 Tax=Heterorhabditis bacteriophora TaxID=37862 RepID=A0A1I7WJF0_HETBA
MGSLKFTLQQIGIKDDDEIILVSNFKYLFFVLYYVDMIFGIDSDEFIAKSCESYRKIVFYEKSVNFLDLYKKSLHQYIPTYKIIMGFEVVFFNLNVMALKSGYQKTIFKYMSGNCPFSQEIFILLFILLLNSKSDE